MRRADRFIRHATDGRPTSEHHVNKALAKRIPRILLPALLLAGCGTPAARDFGGRWKPVNRFRSATTEIPLGRHYTYYAAPMDETLRNMLIRWATDTGMTLVYHLPSDYTLFAPVAKLRTGDVEQAAEALSSIYAKQGIRVSVAGDQLRVDPARPPGPELAPATVGQAIPTSSSPTGRHP